MLRIKDKKSIKSTALHSNNINFIFDHVWFQEDIADLCHLIFTPLENIDIKEKIIGADRENIRFQWHQRFNFIINFDFYSQSCWLEAEDSVSQSQLPSLYSSIKVEKS